MKKLFALIFALLPAVSVMAVTDAEMEQAKVIAALQYLRFANNGSDYLEKLTPKTMAELLPSLKAKEKENIKDFNSVKVPGDYASWDKTKLVEFWSVTFFTSPNLAAEGKTGLARARVRSRVEAMEIAAPKAADSKSESAKSGESNETDPSAGTEPDAGNPEAAEMPTAEEAQLQQEELLADQQAIQKDAEEASGATGREESHTWVYVLVLVILVGIVVWLVVYAANLMKRQTPPAVPESAGAPDEGGNGATEKLHKLTARLQQEEGKNAELAASLEKLKAERDRLTRRVSQLTQENERLELRLQEERHLEARNANIRREPEQREQPRMREESSSPREIYLGRANSRGIFVRGDRRYNAGNSVYVLDTADGLVGTFRVVDRPETVDLVLSNPSEYLGHGAQADDLDDTAGVTGIATENPGTAIFENGYWKVLRKSRIRYE